MGVGPVGDKPRVVALSIIPAAGCCPFYFPVLLLSPLSCVSLSCVSPAVPMRDCLC